MRIRALDTALAWGLRASIWIGCFALGLMMVIGAVDVIGTALFRKPVVGAFEMSKAALAVVMFIGLVQVQAHQSHIVVDLFVSRLRNTPKRLADCLALLGTLAALYLIARQTWPLMIDSWRIREVAGGVFNFPIYPIKTLVCLGASIAALVAAGQLLQAILKLFAGKGAERI